MVPQRIVPVTDKPQREPDHEQKDRSGVADKREVQRGKRGNNQSCGTQEHSADHPEANAGDDRNAERDDKHEEPPCTIQNESSFASV